MPVEELRHSLRALRRAPGLTAVSVLTVALGVGAGTSLFSVVKAVLLNPLPYPQADRVAWIAEASARFKDNMVSYPDFVDFQRQNRSFGPMAAYGKYLLTIGNDNPRRAFAASVSEDFLQVIGVQPILGRNFSVEEQRPEIPTAIILGYGLWQQIYGGDRGIIGKTIPVQGLALPVIGVMPPGFNFPDESEAWLPLGERTNSRTAHNYRVIGRLRPGVTVEQARTDLDAIARRIKQQYPNPFQNPYANVVSLYTHLVGPVRPALLMLFAAVGFLLLIVCVNVANLLLVQVTARARELAIRTALGAARWRLLRQMLVESVALALAGGALGLLVASWSMELLKIVLPANVPRVADIRIDTGVVVFALAISMLAGILFGALPAWRAGRFNVNETLRAGSRSYTASKESHRTQAALVISEVALSLILVAGAGLLAQSFWKLSKVNPGFRSDHVLAASISYPASREDPTLIPKQKEVLRQVAALPGVQVVGAGGGLPMGQQSDGFFVIENQTGPDNADAVYEIVSPGYFKALGIPLVRGREFTAADTETSNRVTVINAAMARAYFPGVDPIGRRIAFPSFEPGKPLWLTIVGVAADTRQYGLTSPTRAGAYVCYTQVNHTGRLADTTLFVRTPLEPSSLAPAIRSRLGAVDRSAAVSFRTMDDVMAEAVARQRFQMRVLAAFAVLALLLAVIGLYGLLSYRVSQSRVEIGIRLALGAQPRNVFQMVTGRALALAGIGAAFGMAGCMTVRKLLATLLFGIGPGDPATLASATLVLMLAALAASAFPALRATRVDPATALREE